MGLHIDFNPLHHPFPWLVSAGNVTSVLFTRRGKITGWYVLAAAQMLFIVHSLTTPTDTGFILGNIMMMTVAIDSIRDWCNRRSGRVPEPLEPEVEIPAQR